MNSIQQLNDYSLQPVNYDDQGLGLTTLANRYQINGALDTSKSVAANIDAICSAAGSWLSYELHSGKWGVVINNSGTSVASFSDKNVIGTISLTGTGITGLYNSAKVQFPHRDIRNNLDFVTISIPDSDKNANEPTNTLNLTYNTLNEPIQAQLLGIIELKQSRIDKTIKFQTDFSYLDLRAGDLIDVTNSRLGFTSKLFRIITITEIIDHGGLKAEIVALEYDPNVYSTVDLYRYTRTDSNGIITQGAIGVPGTPIINKYERDARPHLTASSLSPTGVVEAIEYWLTADVSASEQNRVYYLIGTIRPTTGITFSDGTEVILDYDILPTGNFLIKTRGINSYTSGPFSTPSGLIQYSPQQVTDAIGPSTGVLDQYGSLIAGLAASYVLGQVGDLISGNTSSALLSTIRDGLQSIGLINSSTYTTSTNTGTTGGGVGGPTQVPGTTGITTATTLFKHLAITATYPADRTTNEDPLAPNSPNRAPITGSYYISFAPVTETITTTTNTLSTSVPRTTSTSSGGTTVQSTNEVYTLTSTSTSFTVISTQTMYGPLTLGSGSVKLYKSNGTLVETLSASSLIANNNVIELPFAPREKGTDYYILMDAGVVSYCDWPNLAINDPLTWNFNTPPGLTPTTPLSPNVSTPASYTSFTPILQSINLSGSNVEKKTHLIVTFNYPILKGTGSFYIKEYDTGNTVGTIVGTAGTIVNGYSIDLGAISSYVTAGTHYYVTASAGAVVSNTGGDCYSNAHVPSTAYTNNDKDFTVLADFMYVSYAVESTGTANLVSPQTNIFLTFNRQIAFGSSGNITLKSADGSTHQTFDVSTSFGRDKTSEIMWVSGNVLTLNPTKDLTLGTTYYVNADAGSITDTKGFAWTGLSNSTTIRFTIDTGPNTTISDPNVTGNISMTFDRGINPGDGALEVVDNLGNVVASLPATDPSVIYS